MLLKAKVEAQTYAVEGLIADGSVNLVVGDSGIGKTPLLVQMGLSIAEGLPFCGRPTSRGIVLYVDCENGKETFATTVGRLSQFMGRSTPPEEFIVYSPQWDERPEILHEPLLSIQAIIEEIRPRVVIIDPLRVIWPRAEIKSEDTMAMIQHQRRLSRLYGCAWVNIHHCRKPSREREHDVPLASSPHEWLLEAAGSRALINQTDTRLGVVKEQDLLVAGFARVLGPIPAFRLQRSYHPQLGEPIGYKLIHGFEALNGPQIDFLRALPPTFIYREAEELWKAKHGGKLSSWGLNGIMKALIGAGVLKRKDGESGFEKTGVEGTRSVN